MADNMNAPDAAEELLEPPPANEVSSSDDDAVPETPDNGERMTIPTTCPHEAPCMHDNAQE